MYELGIVLVGVLIGIALSSLWRAASRDDVFGLRADPWSSWEVADDNPPPLLPPQDGVHMGRVRYGASRPGPRRKVRGKRPRKLDE